MNTNDPEMIEAASLLPCPFCDQLPERMGKTNYRNNVLIVCRGKDCPINGVVVPADKWPSESCDRCEWLIGGLTMCYSVYGIPSIECYLPKTVVEREKQRRIDHPFQDWHTLHAARQQTDIAVRDAWTPVSERLPEADGGYLIQDAEGFMLVSYFQTKLQRFVVVQDELVTEPIAWRPLPQPLAAEIADGREKTK